MFKERHACVCELVSVLKSKIVTIRTIVNVV
jgi:hypothetical protein